MHLSIVPPSPKPAWIVMTLQSNTTGEIRRFYNNFLHKPLEECQKFTASTFPCVVAGWRGVFVQRFDHVFCCWLAKLYAS